MTFEEFQQLCNQAASTSVPMSLPCPIVIGDPADSMKAGIGDAYNHYTVIFTTTPNNSELLTLYQKVSFRFNEPTNQTVITPLTHGG